MQAARSRQLPPVRPLGRRALAVLGRFLHVEAIGGVILLVAVLAALAWANSPLRGGYAALWQASIFFHPLHFWINDGLMTAFFLVVGAEIRREMHSGALSSLRQAALPVVAAVGGVIVPALIYLALNLDPARRPGWAVPTATDIAFAVGVLALLGRRIPDSVRMFLLTLAIVDDIVAVLIIALFYAGGLDWRGFAITGLGVLAVLGLQRLRVGRAAAYVIPGAIVWVGLFQAGVHPTLAGVVLGLMTPVLPVRAHEQPPAVRVPQALHPWVAYGILPLFALANAGVATGGIDWSQGGTPWIAAGIAVALVAGKPLGVMGASWLAVRLGWCALPPDVSWRGVALIGLLAGIGFTMSIFIATLGFADEQVLAAAKLGVLAGSTAAGALGLAWGAACAARTRNFSVPQ